MTEKAKGVLVEMFGESPLVKTMDFFMTYPDFEYTKNFVAKEIGISRMTMEKIWRDLTNRNFIIKTRSAGNADYYKLNEKNSAVLHIERAINKIIWEELENEKIAIKH